MPLFICPPPVNGLEIQIHQQMKLEREAFLAHIPAHMQDQQADAIRQALAGNFEALRSVRKSRNPQLVTSPGVEVCLISDHLRLYMPQQRTPQGKALPLLIYLHGGGWTFGSLNSCAKFCDALAATGTCDVLAVDYRLAPDFPYPCALEDCLSAWHTALKKAETWGVDPHRISIGGDSSGGNLAIATALRLACNKENDRIVMPRSLLLFYPVTKAWADGSPSWQSYRSGYGLDSRLMETFNEAYAPDSQRRTLADISPALASRELLGKMPRTLLVAAGRDILSCQGADFIRQLEDAGVDARRICFSEAAHLFITVDGQPTAFSQALNLSVEFLKESPTTFHWNDSKTKRPIESRSPIL